MDQRTIPEDLRERWTELNTWVRGPVTEDTEMPNEIGRLSELRLIERIALAESQAAELREQAKILDKINGIFSAYDYAGGDSYQKLLHMEADMLQAKRALESQQRAVTDAR